MTILLAFAAGVCVGGFLICLLWKLTERDCQPGGLLDFTGIHTTKGGTVSADSTEAEGLSGGGSSPRPHLTALKGGK